MYLAPPASTGSAISLGGLIFGFGMVFAGGCPSRNLARAGGGDLRSLLTLIVLGLVRLHDDRRRLRAGARRARAGDQPSASGVRRQSLGDLLSATAGPRAAATGSLLVTALIAAAALAYCFADASFRTSPVHVVSGRRRRPAWSSPAGR